MERCQKAEELFAVIFQDEFLTEMFRPYFEVFEREHQTRILDYGCGYGWGSAYLSKDSRQVLGYDVDQKRIQCAKEIYMQTKNLEFTYDWKEVESFRGEFDTVVMSHVLSETSDTEWMAKQVLSVLKEDGRLYLAGKYRYIQQMERLVERIDRLSKIEWEQRTTLPLKGQEGICFMELRIGKAEKCIKHLH